MVVRHTVPETVGFRWWTELWLNAKMNTHCYIFVHTDWSLSITPIRVILLNMSFQLLKHSCILLKTTKWFTQTCCENKKTRACSTLRFHKFIEFCPEKKNSNWNSGTAVANITKPIYLQSFNARFLLWNKINLGIQSKLRTLSTYLNINHNNIILILYKNSFSNIITWHQHNYFMTKRNMVVFGIVVGWCLNQILLDATLSGLKY